MISADEGHVPPAGSPPILHAEFAGFRPSQVAHEAQALPPEDRRDCGDGDGAGPGGHPRHRAGAEVLRLLEVGDAGPPVVLK
jgi:hypothetical protein